MIAGRICDHTFLTFFNWFIRKLGESADKDAGTPIDPNRNKEVKSKEVPQSEAGRPVEDEVDTAVVEAFRQWLNDLTGKPDAPKDPNDLISNWGPDGKPIDIGRAVESILSYTNRLDPIINWGPNGKPQLNEEEIRAQLAAWEREKMNGDPTIINPGYGDSFGSSTGGDSSLSQQNDDSDSGNMTTSNSENDSAKIV